MCTLTKTDLRTRGWSERLIGKLLGAPDRTAPNPYCSHTAILMWDVVRVDEAEKHPEFLAYQEQRRKRSAAVKASAEKKRQELLKAIEEMPVTVERRPPDKVLEAARRDWENWQAYRYQNYEASGRSASPETRHRWAVNFIRHNLTAYDGHLAEIAGKMGVIDAARCVHRHVLEKIAEAYPEFADECDRQIRHRHG
jgi:hypothetical protein